MFYFFEIFHEPMLFVCVHSTFFYRGACYDAKLIIYSFFFSLLFPSSAVVITSPRLQASPGFSVHLTQQPARTALSGVGAWLWHPSFPSRSRSRAAGRALPAPREEGDDKVEVSIWPSATVGKFWLQLVTLSTLSATLEDHQPWFGGPVLFRKNRVGLEALNCNSRWTKQ